MTIYAIEFVNENGKDVIPGVSEGEKFRSTSPLPIPDVGESVDVLGTTWTVTKRLYSYDYQGDEGNFEPAITVHLHCKRAS